MSELWRDVHFGFRLLLRQPGFTVAAIVSLMLGIGTNTALFTLAEAFYLRPLPVEDLDRLVSIHQTFRGPEDREFSGDRGLSWENFQVYRENNRSFEDLALFFRSPMNLALDTTPERVWGAYTSSSYFDSLGISPARGRLFQPGDDRADEVAPVAVISHGAWQRLFAADPEAVGSTVRINGYPFTVIGVAPRGFAGTELNAQVDLWLPAPMFPNLSPLGKYYHQRDAGLFRCFGRLLPGVSREAAQADLHALSVSLSSTYLSNDESLGIGVLPLWEASVPEENRDLFYGYGRTLILAVGLILLIACLNVSALLLVRGFERSREIALRQAVGASPGRVTRQLVVESLLLFVIGGLLSLPLAYGTLRLLWNFRPPQFDADALDLQLHWTAAGFALVAATVTGVIFGLLPAIQTARPELSASLRKGKTGDLTKSALLGRRIPVRNLLVVLQVALALVALIGAGLYVGSLRKMTSIDLGFESQRLALVRISPGEQGLEQHEAMQLYRQAVDRLEALPGVRSVALSENRLLRGAVVRNQVYLDGDPQPVESPLGPDHRTNTVSPGFFSTVGIPLIAGDDFDGSLGSDGPLVVIINETMARTLWPGEPAVGKRIHFTYPSTPPLEVIGVAADARYRQIVEPPQFFLYVPLAQNYVGSMTLHIRTEGDPADVLPAARKALLELRPDLVLAEQETIGTFVDNALWAQRSAVAVAGAFSVLAVILSMVGVYGVVSYSVAQGRRNLSIRAALGARPQEILRSVLIQVVWILISGITLGWILGYLLLRPFIESQLFGISASDPSVFGLQALLLMVVALVGSLVPARKALAIDPMIVLRGD